MNTVAIRRSTLALSALSLLPHIFCCGIPAAVAIISLGTTVGLGAALVVNPLYAWVDAYHMPLLILAVSGVLFSGVLNWMAYRMDCRHASCTENACQPKKSQAFRLFLISLGLLALDLAWFSTEEFVLGLHHHDVETTDHSHHTH